MIDKNKEQWIAMYNKSYPIGYRLFLPKGKEPPKTFIPEHEVEWKELFTYDELDICWERIK